MSRFIHANILGGVNLSNLDELRKSISEISVYDMSCYSAIELCYMLGDKMKTCAEALNYLLEAGVNAEVVDQLARWKEDGTLQQLINEGTYNDIVKQVNEFKRVNLNLKPQPQLFFFGYQSYIGDCMIIKTRDGNYYMIDTGGADEYEYIKSKMKKYNVSADIGENNRLSKYIHESDILQENWIFNSDDIYLNFDEWKPKKKNILYVTGLSGSGKSTLANELGLKYKAEVISLDFLVLSCFADKNKAAVIKNAMNGGKAPEIILESKENKLTFPKLFQIKDKLYLYMQGKFYRWQQGKFLKKEGFKTVVYTIKTQTIGEIIPVRDGEVAFIERNYGMPRSSEIRMTEITLLNVETGAVRKFPCPVGNLTSVEEGKLLVLCTGHDIVKNKKRLPLLQRSP